MSNPASPPTTQDRERNWDLLYTLRRSIQEAGDSPNVPLFKPFAELVANALERAYSTIPSSPTSEPLGAQQVRDFAAYLADEFDELQREHFMEAAELWLDALPTSEPIPASDQLRER